MPVCYALFKHYKVVIVSAVSFIMVRPLAIKGRNRTRNINAEEEEEEAQSSEEVVVVVVVASAPLEGSFLLSARAPIGGG